MSSTVFLDDNYCNTISTKSLFEVGRPFRLPSSSTRRVSLAATVYFNQPNTSSPHRFAVTTAKRCFYCARSAHPSPKIVLQRLTSTQHTILLLSSARASVDLTTPPTAALLYDPRSSSKLRCHTHRHRYRHTPTHTYNVCRFYGGSVVR